MFTRVRMSLLENCQQYACFEAYSVCLMFNITPLTLTSGHPFDANPPDREHCGVVVDVQERHLAVFLLQNKEQRVEEFNEL